MSAWSPFKYRAYTVLWVAGLVSNIGTWVFNVASGWLMTELDPSAFMVSLVQVATALPIFALALPAGAVADIFDRRKILLFCQVALALALMAFTLLLHQGSANAWILLAFTFLNGVGTAFSTPAFQAIVPKLVPREVLRQAIALNGIGINIARALGPALGGVILSTFSVAAAVGLDALSYLVAAAGVLWWRAGQASDSQAPPERVVSAMISGLRFARHSQAARSTLCRAVAFFFFASAYWALLPLVAKELLHGGPELYGMLLTLLGVGAVSAAFVLPRLSKMGADRMVALGTLVTALAQLGLAYGGGAAIGLSAAFLAGVAWIMVLSNLNVSMQLALPDWMRARGMALFQMMFFGAMTVGSLLWGQVGTSFGLEVALAASSLGAVIGIGATRRHLLNLGEMEDHEPSRHWAEPNLQGGLFEPSLPVTVIVEYQVQAEQRERFLEVMDSLGRIRKRLGAITWDITEVSEEPGRFLEVVREDSWEAHLRTHARVPRDVQVLQDQLLQFVVEGTQPKVLHALTARRHVSGSKVTDSM